MHLASRPTARCSSISPWALGLMHAAVDASTVCLLVWATGLAIGNRVLDGFADDQVWRSYLLYNALAFGTQFPLGALADRWRLYRAAVLVGLLAIMAAAGCAALVPQAAVVLAALGNAAFHVGAGALVLQGCGTRTSDSGVFVGPGAIGLAIGLWAGKAFTPHFTVLLVPPLLCVAGLLLARNSSVEHREATSSPWRGSRMLFVVCVAAMVLIVAFRTANGHSLTSHHDDKMWALGLLAVASCMGNMAGGYLADCFGWMRTCVVALLLSAIPLALAVDHAIAAVCGMFLFQMTMPVTLTVLWRVYPQEPGFAFGIAALGVLVGAAFVFLCPPTWFTAGASLLVLTALSLAAFLPVVFLLKRM